MSQTFRLYWLRETACDAGTLVDAAALDPSVRDRVLAFTGGDDGEFLVRLPFLDRREWRDRQALLSAVPMERVGNLIRSVLDPPAATRDLAATLIFTDPSWIHAPAPASADFQVTWQRVSTALQKGLREWIPREFLADPSRCEDRPRVYALAVYQGSRPFAPRGRAKSEFAYDLRGYPDCRNILMAAWRLTGRPTQDALAQIEEALNAVGRAELARLYSPVWAEDVRLAVRRRPKRFVDLLATDSVVINSVVDLASDPTAATAIRAARAINGALRDVLGMDLRKLGVVVLEEATRILANLQAAKNQAGGREHLLHTRPLKDPDVCSPGSPDLSIARNEDSDHGRADGRG
jgi:hypothetical protein